MPLVLFSGSARRDLYNRAKTLARTRTMPEYNEVPKGEATPVARVMFLLFRDGFLAFYNAS